MTSCIMITALGDDDNMASETNPAQVEVRAVFINCELDGRGNNSPDNEATRFEREELFKHSALRDCCIKLAVTVKINSEPNLNSGDEYLPIEHVFEGAKKKRVRLLNPYVLRLRREPPLQAYKLRRIDTITGVLTNSKGDFEEKTKRHIVRGRRKSVYFPAQEWSLNKTIQDKLDQKSLLIPTHGTQWIEPMSGGNKFSSNIPDGCANRQFSYYTSHDPMSSREKRSERNIVVEAAIDNKHSQVTGTDHNFQGFDIDLETNYDNDDKALNKDTSRRKSEKHQSDRNNRRKTSAKNKENLKTPVEYRKDDKTHNNKINYKTERGISKDESTDFITYNHQLNSISRDKKSGDNNFDLGEKDYAMYEIGDPELWYNAHLQLFEKLSTPEGKTLWNDLTKGEQASVSSQSPEWIGPDLNVRYRPADWLSRDQYTLPDTKLCLLAPIRNANTDTSDNATTSNDGDYIVVPVEDIVNWEEDGDNRNKRNDNYSDTEFSTTSTEQTEERMRRVIVRTSRALFRGSGDKVAVASQGDDRYLMLPHQRLHHAQIDLEARADKNELVRVGASGRISTAVADSTRRTRTVITVQTTNTGLAAARFSVVARDCGPALSNLIDDKGSPACAAGPVLIAPRHTQNLRLQMPELPLDSAHCSVVLLNADDEPVAVRDVTVKKGDRCFCVWHCDCVCLGDDPKLLCREMAEARQAAAGLPNRDRTRHSRSVYCADDPTTDVIVVVIGVIFFLLFLGIIKAFLGLMFRCIGTWGLTRLLQAPRKLDRYYENSLASRNVEYDDQGWPVHPDTKQRTVQLVSWPMEFILNTIFFISIPCILVQEALKQLCSRCPHTDGKTPESNNGNKTKCFSSHDMQGAVAGRARRRRRRRRGLRRWMTPGAQALSADIWQNDLPIKHSMNVDSLKPLLLQEHACDSVNETHESAPDSEQDDTDYVITQMQKSRESLIRSQRKLGDPEHPILKTSQ